jgi:PAS domain S-box-containing protein
VQVNLDFLSPDEAYVVWKQEPHRLFEQAPEAILVFDDGLRYIDANAAACQLLHRTKEEVVGKRVGDFSSEDGARLALRVREASGMTPVEESLTVILPDGGVRFIEVVTRPNVLPGVHASFSRDVTERKRLQYELEHHNRLEAIGKVAGGVAHDFNNMLTAIMSYTDLQLQQLPQDGAMRRYAMGIQAAAARAAETTQQLLAFCRRQSMKFSELDVNDVVSESAKLVRRLIGENIQLVLELDRELPPVVADRGQLNQVLVNLAVNARDAMPRGGRILIVTAKRIIEAERSRKPGDLEPGTYVSTFVHDSGLGISNEVLPHIFDPFFTTKALGKGTGLGLSTVYGIVRQSKGQIHVNSEPGRGTTFEIVLPAARLNNDGLGVPPSFTAAAYENIEGVD